MRKKYLFQKEQLYSIWISLFRLLAGKSSSKFRHNFHFLQIYDSHLEQNLSTSNIYLVSVQKKPWHKSHRCSFDFIWLSSLRCFYTLSCSFPFLQQARFLWYPACQRSYRYRCAMQGMYFSFEIDEPGRMSSLLKVSGLSTFSKLLNVFFFQSHQTCS